MYGRDGNPTWEGLEDVLGALEGGSALVFGSGMAAASAVMETLPVPGRVVVGGDAYNGTRRFLIDVAGRGRLRFRTVDVAATAATLAACAEVVEAPGRPSGDPHHFGGRGLLWLESPTNPLLAVADLEALVAGAHQLGMDVVVDNTFATPLLQRPLDLGADVVDPQRHQAAGRPLGCDARGHRGAAARRGRGLGASALAARRRRRTVGGLAGPAGDQNAVGAPGAGPGQRRRAGPAAGRPSAGQQVRYPGLPDHPGHDLAARQMRGFGTMVAFDVAGGASAAEAVVAARAAGDRRNQPGRG